jgi:hypothetical protein
MDELDLAQVRLVKHLLPFDRRVESLRSDRVNTTVGVRTKLADDERSVRVPAMELIDELAEIFERS